jgi:endonuclease/exonuclease/phosphatase family metal-dependent hydrolase
MLRLMTLNLNYRASKHGAWSERRALIVEAIRRVDADVVALQAVERSNGHSQAAELAAALNYEYADFVAAVKTGPAAKGSAFIGRRRLMDLAVQRLRHRGDHEDGDRRVVLRARIQTRGGDVDIYSAHFSWIEAQAMDNVADTLAFVAPGPAILLGDLNSQPDSAPMRELVRAGWIDMWRELHQDDPGYTFEADRPTMRIDYVLASRDVRPRIKSIERVGAEKGRPPRLSDHLGLVVTLSDA